MTHPYLIRIVLRSALYMILYPEVKVPGVPLTIVVVDGSPAASAVGEFEPEFWEFLIEKHLEIGKFLRVDFEGNVQVTDRDEQLRTDIARVLGLSTATTTTIESSGDADGGVREAPHTTRRTTKRTTYTVITVTKGGSSGEDWTLLLASLSSLVILCAIAAAYLKLRSRPRAKIASRRGREMTVGELLAPVIAATLADSVNPCTFSVFTALMLMITFFKGRARMLQAGGAFIAAVYLMYYLMGLGLIRVFAEFWWLVYVVAATGIALGSYELYTSLAERRFKSPPAEAAVQVYRENGGRGFEERSDTPLLRPRSLGEPNLLPGSSGPYLVALYLMSKLCFCEVCGLLCLYNLIFVAP